MSNIFNTKLISVDIGSKYIKLVYGNVKKNKVHIEKAAFIETPMASFRDGSITTYKTIRKAIASLMENNKIKSKDIIFVSNSTEIITRDLDLPHTSEKDLNSVIKYQMERYLPIKFEDYIMQYSTVDEYKDNGINKVIINVVVYPKHMAEEYKSLSELLVLKPIALDFSANAVNKLFLNDVAINNEDYNKDEIVALIDLGHAFTNISILKGGKLQFTRIMDRGLVNIDEDLSIEMFKSIDECEALRKSHGDLTIEESLMDLSTEEGKVKLGCRRGTIATVEDITRIFQYYRNKSNGKIVQRVYLYGGGSNMKGIEEFFQKYLQIPVTKINWMNNIKLDSTHDLSMYLNAIGALIRL
ncbi:pilus assembly protein PilM [Clostridium sp.]|uniref:pilus assembly protein PilM n=1 Tax=Clostridium sp. TaxID=1506 RepID=UPI002FCB188B